MSAFEWAPVLAVVLAVVSDVAWAAVLVCGWVVATAVG